MPEHHVEEWWECDICGYEHDTEEAALRCETSVPWNKTDIALRETVLAFNTKLSKMEWVEGVLVSFWLTYNETHEGHAYTFVVVTPDGLDREVRTAYIKRKESDA